MMRTNMIDPKRMERIWSKCPELFPDFDGEPLERVISENGEYIARWLGSHELSDSVISALIRDKCVWWLANREGGIGLGKSWCGSAWAITTAMPSFEHADPTEACLLAVERVLGLEPWV